MKTQNVRALTECSIMIALSTVLSLFMIIEMPHGGSVTPASMLPVLILAYRHGTKWGIGSALIASLLQALLGLKNFSYFTTPGSIIALLVFDYVLAFVVFGAFGFLRRHSKNQLTALLTASIFSSVLRYVCHVISGWIFFGQYAFFDQVFQADHVRITGKSGKCLIRRIIRTTVAGGT